MIGEGAHRLGDWNVTMKASTALLGVVLLVAGSVAADEDVPGRALAATCTGCHGPQGRSVSEIPTLSGRAAAELAQLLRDFRDGTRAGSVMPQHAKGYDDAQIERIARWFASQSQ